MLEFRPKEPLISYFAAAPVTDRPKNKARWRQHTLRSVEPLQRCCLGDPPRPDRSDKRINGLRTSCADTVLRPSARTTAITFAPRRVSAQLGTQRSCEIINQRFRSEQCNRDLPFDSGDAMICSFECTFCRNCVESVLDRVCPNCGGNFEPRPVRSSDLPGKYPPSAKRVFKNQS